MNGESQAQYWSPVLAQRAAWKALVGRAQWEPKQATLLMRERVSLVRLFVWARGEGTLTL